MKTPGQIAFEAFQRRYKITDPSQKWNELHTAGDVLHVEAWESSAKAVLDIFGVAPEQEYLRDQFAMAVLAGIPDPNQWSPSRLASYAYQIADAMLAERKKDKP